MNGREKLTLHGDCWGESNDPMELSRDVRDSSDTNDGTSDLRLDSAEAARLLVPDGNSSPSVHICKRGPLLHCVDLDTARCLLDERAGKV